MELLGFKIALVAGLSLQIIALAARNYAQTIKNAKRRERQKMPMFMVAFVLIAKPKQRKNLKQNTGKDISIQRVKVKATWAREMLEKGGCHGKG